MTKAELIEALSWFKDDDAPLHIFVPHEALDGIGQLLELREVRYNLIPGRVDLIAGYSVANTTVENRRQSC